MSTQNTNRVETDLLRLQELEERFKKAFSMDVFSNKALSRERLREYDRIVAKYSNTNDPNERSTLRVLRFERRSLQRKAYPNRLIRWFRQIFVNPVRRYSLSRQYRKLEETNQFKVYNQLKRMGMGEHYRKVEQKMRNGEREFSIPITSHLKENEWINQNLSFEQNPLGEYNLISNKVQIINEAEPKNTKQHVFKLGDGTMADAEESYNLLNGRSVQMDGKWIKFDMNDKDTEGNYRVKEINTSYDLEKCIKELHAKEIAKVTLGERLVEDMKKGKLCEVTIGSKKYFVEANPQFRTINVYDGNFQKISIAEAQGKRFAKEHLSEKEAKTKVTKKNGLRLA